MKHLSSLNKYFVKYRGRLVLGLFFVTIANLLAVVGPVIVRMLLDDMQSNINSYRLVANSSLSSMMQEIIYSTVLYGGLALLGLALVRGVFMFLMRQTLIVMSRYIEYDQKKEIYDHYQQLDWHFFKTHFTGDLMNRISEDVSRVRMYTGPSIMYATNLTVLTIMCVWGMARVDYVLTLMVIVPLPLLALTIYYVNSIIHRKTEKIQAQLSTLTATAQESYSGIRMIKSFVQEPTLLRVFNRASEAYRKSAINLSFTEAVYFPSMNLFIGLSMLFTIVVGGYLVLQGKASIGNIAEFVIYINLLMFPISSIGWTASMVQRAAVSQQRIDEFLHTPSAIQSAPHATSIELQGNISFQRVHFTYQHTGIQALKDFSLSIRKGEKIAVIGKTGSGKSTLAHLLLRMYDLSQGSLTIEGVAINTIDLNNLRTQIAYAPQEAFLFSDTIFNNISFGKSDATTEEVKQAAILADLDKDISQLERGYDTVVGERGVMLSGGQKQRIGLARALLKNSPLLLLDETLSAVDTQTEKNILSNLKPYLIDKTLLVITHRISPDWNFDKIIVMEDGQIIEQGSHEQLFKLNGQYAQLYKQQVLSNQEG
ncbi:MAG: ABC transporter ATP-binding protein [Bacteroidia bacterium]|nr:MAG: ABC transporter ATP-binding protein [Bacteroidia bacterium]